ncbi:MAG: metallophosphoesterase [Candidatus Thorarchaeota archaeon]
MNKEESSLYAVAVSDVHLGYVAESDSEAFRQFISEYLASQEYVEHLILMGDIFDLWRCDNNAVIASYEEDVLEPIRNMKGNRIGNIHYITGNHDYSIQEDLGGLGSFIDFTREPLRLPKSKEEVDFSTRFFFIHGHRLEWGGILTGPASVVVCDTFCKTGERGGKFLETAWKVLRGHHKREGSPWTLAQRIKSRLLQRELEKEFVNYVDLPPLDRLNKVKGLLLSDYKVNQIYKLLGSKPSEAEEAIREIAEEFVGLEDQYLVFGHTHQAGIGKNIANTGCWYKSKSAEERFATIDAEGDMNLHKWP